MATKKTQKKPPDSTEQFFKQLNILLDEAEQGFNILASSNPNLSDLYAAARHPIKGVRYQVAELRKAVKQEPEVSKQLRRVIEETGAPSLMASMMASPSLGAEDGAGLANVKSGLDLTKDVLDKASNWLPPPWNNISKNIGDVIGIVGKLASDKSPELKKIEELEATLNEMQDELEKVEGKAERLGELAGHPVVTGEDNALVSPPSAEGFKQSSIPGSLLWMIWQNQFKLEHLWRKTFGDDIPSNQEGWVQKPPDLGGSLTFAEKWLRDNGGQIGRLAYKIDKLAELLGKAIVDKEAKWDPEPPIHIGGTIAPDPHRNQLPTESVKEELHKLEILFSGLRQLIIVILNIDILDIDVDVDFVNIINNFSSTQLRRHPLKRIYIYDEGIFLAQTPQDRKRIEVRSPAFDLSGWIDLDDLHVGDAVRVDIYVRLPSGTATGTRRRIYRRIVFRGTGPTTGLAWRSSTGRGVKSLQDICGPTNLAGKAIDIEIKQIASVKGYPSPMRIAYQFVVESNDDGPFQPLGH